MREDHDVASFECRDLRVEPCKVSLVCLIVRGGVPVCDMKKVVEAEANGHLALCRDGGEETATEHGDVRIWQTKGCAVEEDKVPQRRVLADMLLERAEDGERFDPVGVIGFVVPGDEQHGAELLELPGEEVEVVIFVRYCVADVAEQRKVGRSWCDLEDVVGFWSL